MKTLSRFDVNQRLLLYIGIAVIGFLNGDDTFRHLAGPIGTMISGAIGTGLIAWRAFIDRSVSQQKDPSTEPPTTATPSAPEAPHGTPAE